MATVVPWARSRAPSGARAAIPPRTADPGSSGVLATFRILPSVPTTSVKVPPLSAPIRTAEP